LSERQSIPAVRRPRRSTQIGQLRERVTIQEASTATDRLNSETRSWSNIGTDPIVHARVRVMTSHEERANRAVELHATHEVVIRYRSDMDPAVSADAPKRRLVWGSVTLTIAGIKNLDEKRRYLVLTCRQGVNENA